MVATAAQDIVEFGFGYGALVDLTDGQWTQVATTAIRSINTDRGRLSELDYFSAGTCSIVVEDTDRTFDPQNAAGAHFGDLVPGVQVRVRALENGNYHPVFRGHVTAIRQSYSTGLALVTFACVDATRLLSRVRLPQSVYEDTVIGDAPHLYWRLGEATGTVAADASGNHYDGVYRNLAEVARAQDGVAPYGATGSVGLTSMDVGYAVNTFEAAARLTTFPQTIEMWIRADDTSRFRTPPATDTYRLFYQSNSTTASIDIAYQITSTGRYSILEQASSKSLYRWDLPNRLHDGAAHHVVVVINTSSSLLYVDGVAVAQAVTQADSVSQYPDALYIGLPSPTGDPSSGTWPGLFDDLATYNVALSAAQALEHYQAGVVPWDGDNTGTRIGRVLDTIGWPAGLRALDTGETVLGPANIDGRSAWDYMQSVAQTEGGRLFISSDGKVTFHAADRFFANSLESTSQLTFSDDEAGDSVYAALQFSLDDTQVYEAAVMTRDGGIAQTALAAGVVDPISTYTLSGLLFQTDAQSRGLAERTVYRYATAQTRAGSWTVQPHVDSNSWADILDLEIGTRVTLESKPVNTGTQIAVDLVIEKITHTIDGDAWSVTFAGAPVDPNEDNYFTWGGNGATQGWDVGVWR